MLNWKQYSEEKKLIRGAIGNKRERILRILKAKFGVVCWYCGVSGSRYQIDHIVPVCRGGSSDITNLALVCKFCNGMKFGHQIEDFFEWQNHIKSPQFKRLYDPEYFHPLSSLWVEPAFRESRHTDAK